MKVGLIGLGRMGEGMSRRMMRAGIEVWGYRRNYEKANEAYEKGNVDDLPNIQQFAHNHGIDHSYAYLKDPVELSVDNTNIVAREAYIAKQKKLRGIE